MKIINIFLIMITLISASFAIPSDPMVLFGKVTVNDNNANGVLEFFVNGKSQQIAQVEDGVYGSGYDKIILTGTKDDSITIKFTNADTNIEHNAELIFDNSEFAEFDMSFTEDVEDDDDSGSSSSSSSSGGSSSSSSSGGSSSSSSSGGSSSSSSSGGTYNITNTSIINESPILNSSSGSGSSGGSSSSNVSYDSYNSTANDSSYNNIDNENDSLNLTGTAIENNTKNIDVLDTTNNTPMYIFLFGGLMLVLIVVIMINKNGRKKSD